MAGETAAVIMKRTIKTLRRRLADYLSRAACWLRGDEWCNVVDNLLWLIPMALDEDWPYAKVSINTKP